MNSNQKYETIIIGAGIAGLYAAYKIKKKDPDHNLIILERENHIGGRMGTVNFHGTQIAIGAGIGRKHKDKLLQKLLQELRIPINEFKTSTHYAETLEPCDVKRTFEYLKGTYDQIFRSAKNGADVNKENPTFQEFAIKILGKPNYEHFIACAGYTDYEKEAAHHTFTNYGFDDNYKQPWTAIGIPWQKLLQSLQKYINEGPTMNSTGRRPNEFRRTHIQTSQNVTKIHQTPEGVWQVHTVDETDGNKQKRETTRLIVATTIDTVRRLIPESKDSENPLSAIEGQPFLRIYGKFTPESTKIIQQYVLTTTIVPGPIHKLIPINPKQGIYMIVYTDNKGAKFLKKYTSNTSQNRNILCKYLQEALGITQKIALEDIRSFYWQIGTHYYSPSPQPNKTPSQNPKPNLYIIGEMISHNQGWVEGALESVNNIKI